MTAVIATANLVKQYGHVHALDGLDLTVEHGEVHGFLGPNGAGKSTTIRILLGLARRSGGEATVFGEDPWSRAVDLHRRIAYVPGDVSVWPNLSGGEAIDLLARLRGARTKEPAYRHEKQRLMDAFQFDPRKKGRAYSKGNRQKVALIAAFAVPADLYILDEPTSGLDPLMAVIFQREVARAHANGATVLLSSHIMSEVEQLCDRVSIIRAGRVVETGTLTELRHLTRSDVSFAASGVSLDQVARIADVHDPVQQGERIRLTVDSDRTATVLPALAELGISDLRVAPPSLEELFLRHYGDDLAALESAEDGGTNAAGPGTRRARRAQQERA
ncbi:ABC transporter ATP-binding protein [Microbacterium oxydans]|uniref:Daunorubicin/doxorubicin resistance ATP-binding protein DrrA n=1 Tax=Microbacterium oxydans TaxID=82380 RepID=A0A0F0LFQ8_9MICO|nr:ABC transporter ATP-binding protein [Microbacterium oxydans]KJL32057.1 Daunorubicin/doxorubicin resistance ATP-binding protein DrrA [Microbacterium oxydans]